ncbi:MAG TPA: hypothetical protein VFI68_08375 [Anaerolineales bacterium]|nr:hypothetical protein [Anaerolineales bacterium]
MNRILILTLLVCMSATACQAERTPLPTVTFTPTYTADQIIPTPRYEPLPASTKTKKPIASVTSVTSTAQVTLTPPSLSTTATATPNLDKWKELPVNPTAYSNVRDIYENGLLLGNDPHAFSIFGDCQTRPDEFFGVFDTDPLILESLSPELRETVINFEGSFDRESSTSQDGTTPGSLLWDQWHRGEYGCAFGETPVQCELRTHRPSFVIIQIGTHFESRNTEYLRDIINQLIDAGVVPILATKADNRELDNRINRDMALLAAEFNSPLWNFWAALSDLPDRGLYIMKGREEQGAIYLNEEAALRHRMTGLAALNIVWRAATGN